MFVVNIIYRKPIAEIEAQTTAHRAFLDTLYKTGHFLISGPKIPRTGGIIIAKGTISKADLQTLLTEDPYQKQGLAQYDIIEFNPMKHAPELADLL